jgi:hypothetical protein
MQNTPPGLKTVIFVHWYILENLGMENVVKYSGIFNDHWVFLWAFGNFVVIGHIFHRFGILNQEKSGNPV